MPQAVSVSQLLSLRVENRHLWRLVRSTWALALTVAVPSISWEGNRPVSRSLTFRKLGIGERNCSLSSLTVILQTLPCWVQVWLASYLRAAAAKVLTLSICMEREGGDRWGWLTAVYRSSCGHSKMSWHQPLCQGVWEWEDVPSSTHCQQQVCRLACWHGLELLWWQKKGSGLTWQVGE